MNKKTRKAFTLVELLVVIAILAVLATVGIVGYTSFTKKAKISNDTALVSQLNTIMAAEETSGKPKTMYEALQAVNENGYVVEKLTPTTAKYDIVWDQNANRFALLDESRNTVFAEDSFAKGPNVWTIVKSTEKASSETEFSVYLAGNSLTGSVNVKNGFDAGENTGITSVTYTSDAAQDVVIRTNGGTLTINNVNANVKHYGKSEKVLVEAVKSTSYHEFGVVPNIEIKVGRVVVEEAATVSTVVVTGNGVKVESAKEEVEVKVASTVTEQPTITGTNTTPITATMVSTAAELTNAISDNADIVLSANIELSSVILVSNTNVSIDLNGFTLSSNGEVLYVDGQNASLALSGGGLIKGVWSLTADHGATLTMNGANVLDREMCVVSYRSSKLIINSGTFTSNDNAVLGTQGSAGNGGNTITINGGTFNGYIKSAGYIACGIYAANNDTWTVNGGTFNITNGCGILARSGSVTVSKDVVINLANDAENPVRGKVGDSSVMVLTGAYLVDDQAANYPGGKPTLTNNSSYNVTVLNNYN